MAITNYERVGKAMDLLRQGLHPFIERELQAHYGKYWSPPSPPAGATS
ncbi:MAG TPA: Swt1 family HEPN domain-containing protein [Roseiflexaceae bacterium]|nr:Swt1 family HEPN domain-containing protein [Roseiflexaceae bacterium]